MNPTPERLRTIRARAELSQIAAADLIQVSRRTWQYWEAGESPIPWAVWQLFLLRVDAHPDYRLAVR